MYQGKKISVAIASYNGEAYLSQQLDSILGQSVPPDEIVISDDGSTDRTLEIARQYAAQAGSAPAFVILTDNPRHGIGGNFEWAIRHATGDYIFICGQDDVWLPNKVQSVTDIFLAHPGCEMVCHDLICIDPEGNLMPDRKAVCALRMLDSAEDIVKADREPWTERTISAPLVSGAAMCINRDLADRCVPIPSDSAEDQWLQFCAAADDGLYYKNEVLTQYRIHDSASHSYGLSPLKKLRRIVARIHKPTHELHDYVNLSQSMMRYIAQKPGGVESLQAAYRTAERLYDIGLAQIDAVGSGRISGACKLIRLYRTDMRYRRIGRNNFILQLLSILWLSKSRRRKVLGVAP